MSAVVSPWKCCSDYHPSFLFCFAGAGAHILFLIICLFFCWFVLQCYFNSIHTANLRLLENDQLLKMYVMGGWAPSTRNKAESKPNFHKTFLVWAFLVGLGNFYFLFSTESEQIHPTSRRQRKLRICPARIFTRIEVFQASCFAGEEWAGVFMWLIHGVGEAEQIPHGASWSRWLTSVCREKLATASSRPSVRHRRGLSWSKSC